MNPGLIAPLLLHLFTVPMVMQASAQADEIMQTLAQIDQRGNTVLDLTADFREEKFTTLLKKPLVSTGRVFVKGKRTRWQTVTPSPTTLFTDETHVGVFYPSRNTMEVYPVDQRISALMVSPVPRIAMLRQHFELDVLPASTPEYLVLRLTPKEEALAEFVDQIVVSLNVAVGLANRIEITDPEGDRTVISFDNVRPNVGLSDADVARRVPDGTNIIHPLDTDRPAPADATRTNHE